MVDDTNEEGTENVSSPETRHPSPPLGSPVVHTRAQPFRTDSVRSVPSDDDDATVEIVQVLPPPGTMRRHRRCLLPRACCCLTLQQGAVAIGVFQVSVIVLHLLMETLYLCGVLLAGSYALNDDLTGNLPGDEQRWGSMDIAYASISGIILFQELIALLFAGCLLHGARMRRPGLVRAWLIFTGFLLAVDFGLWAARLTLEFMYYPTRGGILLVRAFLSLCTPVYFLLVVRSFYYEMVDEQTDVERGAFVAAPLLYKAVPRDLPPPYTPSTPPYGGGTTPNGAAVGEGDLKRPLETDLDDIDAGFGAGWQQARAAAELATRQQQLQQLQQRQRRREDSEDEEGGGQRGQAGGPLPTQVRTASLADSEGVQLRNTLRTYYEGDPDYDEVAGEEAEAELEAELEAARRRRSRRIVGAGPMVLPPFPPGARASLQHVPPPVSPSPPPSFRQPTLI